jgi:glyoxalase family protein
MKLEGIHHITAITGDAPRNVDFYARVLGLRLVKKSVNQDDPTVYHLFYADEEGDPGSDLTFFEYPGVPEGQHGEGMVHRIVWRVGSKDAQDFWAERLAENDTESTREDDALIFFDPEGLEHELVVVDVPDPPLIAEHPEVPSEHALQGFHAVRAYNSEPGVNDKLFESLGFERADEGWEARGEERGGLYLSETPPLTRPRQGAGSVHHVAWSAGMDEQEAWRERVMEGGGQPTPVIDRFYFLSIYFRTPGGVLFEIATRGPGFAVDEDPDKLGEQVALPPFLEDRRAEIEPKLTPLPNPRAISG